MIRSANVLRSATARGTFCYAARVMAENNLLDDNLYLADIVAKRMYGRLREIDFADVYSDALGGLAEAAEKYDPTFGVKFATYAGTMMRRRIIDGWRIRYGRYESSARRDSLGNLSLDHEYSNGDGTVVTLADSIPTPSDEIGQVDDRSECEWLLEHLSPRDAKIMWDHYGLGISQAMLARREGVTASRICQILDAGKKRLFDVASV